MWYLLLFAVFALYASGLVYIAFRSAGMPFLKRLSHDRKGLARFFCLIFYVLLTALLALLFNLFNALICMLHLYLFWLLCDLGRLLLGLLRKRKTEAWRAGLLAIVLCTLWLSYGWISAHHVQQTQYSFSSPKLRTELRIVQISDAHVGATFHADGLLRYVEEINSCQPDAVVVTGDFVDDDTSRADMLGSCDALRRLETKYGVFFIWGNHDGGYSSPEQRGWSASDLRRQLEANGVTMLEDHAVSLGEACRLVGRRDRSDPTRLRADELLAGLDPEQYIILLDHQPSDFAAEAAAGADLVLCGHTHGGQLIPILHVGEWIHAVDLCYGHKRLQNTDFIVSSGISNWTLQFKTGCISEYVVIDLQPETP